MNRLQNFIPRLFCLIAVSVVLGASGLAQSTTKPEPVTSSPCTSRTGLHCKIYGSGDPIIAIHGLGASMYTWRKLIEKPETFPGYQLILVDLRGAGDSPKPNDKHYSILEQAELIYQFIEEHDLQKLTLMGNSYGGAVSLLVAILLRQRTSHRLAKLILIDSGGYPKPLPLHLKVLRTPLVGWLAVHVVPPKCQTKIVLHSSYYDCHKITRDQIKEYARPIAAPGGRHALLQLGRQAIPKDVKYWISQYPTIEVPTLILWGADDKILPVDTGRMLDAALPNSRLKLIEKCGHVPQEEQPEETICHISEFLGLRLRSCRK